MAQIQEIETFVGLKFPVDYLNHIMNFNGGRCNPNCFSFYEDGKITMSGIDWFLAIYDGEYDNLKDYIETYKMESKRLPQHMLPIAHDPGGNLVCISCGHDDVGCIYFWDHDYEVDYTISNDQDYSNLYLISENLNEFLASLTELDS